ALAGFEEVELLRRARAERALDDVPVEEVERDLHALLPPRDEVPLRPHVLGFATPEGPVDRRQEGALAVPVRPLRVPRLLRHHRVEGRCELEGLGTLEADPIAHAERGDRVHETPCRCITASQNVRSASRSSTLLSSTSCITTARPLACWVAARASVTTRALRLGPTLTTAAPVAFTIPTNHATRSSDACPGGRMRTIAPLRPASIRPTSISTGSDPPPQTWCSGPIVMIDRAPATSRTSGTRVPGVRRSSRPMRLTCPRAAISFIVFVTSLDGATFFLRAITRPHESESSAGSALPRA